MSQLLSAKVGINSPARAVAQSVYSVCRPEALEIISYFLQKNNILRLVFLYSYYHIHEYNYLLGFQDLRV
jgi:hypothetical protein